MASTRAAISAILACHAPEIAVVCSGKTLFSQPVDFLPWTSFNRIGERYQGDRYIKPLSFAQHYRTMAFAQLAYRKSLRDIEVCLAAQSNKCYQMGFRQPIRRATLADANAKRDWRIYTDFAQRLITQDRKLNVDTPLDIDWDGTAYALDSTTIDLCMTLFPRAPFRTTKWAVKMHTLLDLQGRIPSFIHISDGKLHDVKVLELLLIEPGAFGIMDRAYFDFGRLHVLHTAGAFFITRAKRDMDARRLCSAPDNRDTGIICDQTIALNGYCSSYRYPDNLRRIHFKDPDTGKTLIFLTNHSSLPPLKICSL